MNHESKRLLEALDARIERMTEKMLAYQEQREWIAASVSGAWVDRVGWDDAAASAAGTETHRVLVAA